MSSEYEPDLELKAEVDRLVVSPATSGTWSDVEERARKKGWRPEEQPPLAARTDEERFDVPKRASAPRRRRSLRVAVYASIAVVLVAAVAIGSLEAAKYLGKDEPILVIGDDTVGISPGSTGQSVQTPASAFGDGKWHRLPLTVDAGSITALAMDPENPSILYAGTENGGLFKSTDGAEIWTQFSDLSDFGLAYRRVVAIAFDPASPSEFWVVALHAGWQGELFHYLGEDRGWDMIQGNFSLESAEVMAKIRQTGFWKVWVDTSTSPSTIYASQVPAPGLDPPYLFRSSDDGITWEEISFDDVADERGVLVQLIIDSQSRMLYAVIKDALGSGLVRSADGGSTWEDFGSRIPGEVGVLSEHSLALNPDDGRTLYALGASAAHASTDLGVTWVALTSAAAERAHAAAMLSGGQPASNAASGGSGILDTLTDTLGSSGWTITDAESGASLEVTTAVFADPTDPSTVYVGANSAVYKSTDAGRSWEARGLGIVDSVVTQVVVDPTNPSVLYAVTSVGIVKSGDGGATWDTILEGATSLVLAPSLPSRLYAIAGGVMRSDNGGLDWVAVGSSGTVGKLALVAADAPDTLFAYGSDLSGDLRRSTDGGATWKSSSVGMHIEVGVKILGVDPQDPATLYAHCWGYASYGGLFKSTDSGATWSALAPGTWGGGGVSSMAVDPQEPNIIWAAAAFWEELPANQILYSDDGGATWEKRELAGTETGTHAFDIYFAPGDANTLYATMFAPVGTVTAVCRSTDGGANWMDIGEGLPSLSVGSSGTANNTALLSSPDGSVYLVTGGDRQGLWKWAPAR
jgi:hypothetical protein